MKVHPLFSQLVISESYNRLEQLDTTIRSSLPIQIHQTELIKAASGAVPKRSSIKQNDDSKVSYNHSMYQNSHSSIPKINLVFISNVW